MIEQIIENINSVFGNAWITTLIVSMIPLIELKGAIVFGTASGLGVFQSFVMSYLGSTIVCIPLFFLLRPILNLLKKIKWFRFAAIKVEYLFVHKAEKLSADSAAKRKDKNTKLSPTAIMMLGVFAFVAVPLPMTGVWTGTAIAVFLGLRFIDTLWPVALGNLIAGILISILTYLLADYVNYILIGFAVVAVALFIVFIVKVVRLKVPEELLKAEKIEK